MHQITNTSAFESYPQYSPVGESIFYLREHNGHRHVWKTDKDGQSHEQLTFGRMTDTLVDVSPDGDSLIIRSSYWAGGKGMAVTPAMLYSVSTKEFIEKDIGTQGYFLDDQILLYGTGHYGIIPRFGTYNLKTRQRHILGDGYIEGLSPNKKNVLISRDPNHSYFYQELIVFDLDEQSEKRIGTGRDACFWGDSKVVFFVHPSRNKMYVYSLESGITEEVELPGAMLTTPTIATGNRGILLRLESPNDNDRSGNIYLLNDDGIAKLTQ